MIADQRSKTNRGRKSEQMVPIRRPGLYHRGFGHGVGHDTGAWLPLLWSRTEKIGSIDDLGLYGLILHRDLPMVLLGLFSGFLSLGNKWFHW